MALQEAIRNENRLTLCIFEMDPCVTPRTSQVFDPRNSSSTLVSLAQGVDPGSAQELPAASCSEYLWSG